MRNSFLDVAISAVKEAAELILEYYGKLKEINLKADFSRVTEADYASDSLIKEILYEKFPDHSVLSEESGLVEKGSEYLWVIDPIDGTTNFSVKNPFFAISLGLIQNRTIPQLGVVFSPLQDELFYAEKNKGAYLNNRSINVNNSLELEKSFIAYANGRKIEYRRQLVEIFTNLKIKNNIIRQVGAASLELCYVASGRFGAFFMPGINSWDVIAGAMIVNEAKGVVTDFKNNPFSISSEDIIASTKKIHPILLQTINQSLSGSYVNGKKDYNS